MRPLVPAIASTQRFQTSHFSISKLCFDKLKGLSSLCPPPGSNASVLSTCSASAFGLHQGKQLSRHQPRFSEFLLYGCLLAGVFSWPGNLWGSRFVASFGEQGGKQCLIALIAAVSSGAISSASLLLVHQLLSYSSASCLCSLWNYRHTVPCPLRLEQAQLPEWSRALPDPFSLFIAIYLSLDLWAYLLSRFR